MCGETVRGESGESARKLMSNLLGAATTNGSIDTDFPVAVHGSRRNELQGTIGRGGPEVRLRTTNGGIEVRSHPGDSMRARGAIGRRITRLAGRAENSRR